MYSYVGEIDQLLKLKCNSKTAEEFCQTDVITEALKVCSAYLLDDVMNLIKSSNESKQKIENQTLALHIERSSLAHIRYITYQIMLKSLVKFKDLNLRKHFTNLTALLGITALKTCVLSGYDAGYFKQGDQHLIEQAYNLLLA